MYRPFMRTASIALLACVAVLTIQVAAQVPAGWSVRVDRSTSASDPDNTPNLKFATMGKGFHVTSGPAGVFWNPANTTTGDFGLDRIQVLPAAAAVPTISAPGQAALVLLILALAASALRRARRLHPGVAG